MRILGLAARAFGLLLASAGLAAAAPLALTVAHADLARDNATNSPALSLILTPEATAAFAEFTTAEVGHQIEVRIDGEVVMTPRLMDPILGGELWISGRFEEGELAALATRISSGAVVEVEAVAE